MKIEITGDYANCYIESQEELPNVNFDPSQFEFDKLPKELQKKILEVRTQTQKE